MQPALSLSGCGRNIIMNNVIISTLAHTWSWDEMQAVCKACGKDVTDIAKERWPPSGKQYNTLFTQVVRPLLQVWCIHSLQGHLTMCVSPVIQSSQSMGVLQKGWRLCSIA